MTEQVPTDLATALADRYELRDVLGRGGMATVYMAYDRKHLRDVALKVLRPEIAATIGGDRFLKEIQIVARMVHPHILSLHDSGEAGVFVYYVMPYITGGSLRDVMMREKRLATARAIEIARPIADALTYAHELGVLHRDIKPENVLFAKAHPIVADFGIAKAVSSATSGVQLTRTGISLGTPGYMSPEQAAGFTDVDARTDVYSLAILVYEMIVGEIPGRWVTEDSTRAGRFVDCAAAHRAYLSAAGSVIEGALVRALALRPDHRTQTPAGFMDELTGAAVPVKRRYRADEVEAIVSRAAEIEASNPTMSGAMTMGGIEQVARELGIDQRHVRAALADRIPGSVSRESALVQPKRNVLIGGPTRLLYERVVDGEISEGDYPILVEEIRRVVGEVGSVSQLGHSFTWVLNRSQSGIRLIEISVSARAGRTRIMAQENLGALIGAVFGGIGGGAGGGGFGMFIAPLMAEKILAPAALGFIVPAWLAIVYSVSRFFYGRSVKARAEKLEYLVDRLAMVCREMIAEVAPPQLAPPDVRALPRAPTRPLTS